MITLHELLEQGYIDDWMDVNVFVVKSDGSIDKEDDDDLIPNFSGSALNIPYRLLDAHLVSKELQELGDIEGALRPMGGKAWGFNIFIED